MQRVAAPARVLATVLCSRDIGPKAPPEGAETGGGAKANRCYTQVHTKESGSEYVNYTGDAFATVAFFKDGSHKLACAGQKGHFHVYITNTVVIWNTRRTHPVKRLIGHTSGRKRKATVNAVSGNPVDNSMVASDSCCPSVSCQCILPNQIQTIGGIC
ncbi:hypothetical protein niasHT_036589 [Heterodera trifolii]|uniref:Uncharacterized protein n=1 Tax=Heterodera trifolii TaxID=157864 RepID=A0ABD2I517_9BILA